MKRLAFLTILALAATPALAVIAGGPHDLASDITTPNSRTCIVCHTPHNAGPPSVPLWNHTTSALSYTAYDSSTMQAVDNDDWTGADGTISALCMSCHDGSVAIGSLYNGTPGDTTTLMDGFNPLYNLGTDLSEDHPVAFTYNGTLATADGELLDPGSLPTAFTLFGTGGDQMECGTCHDPHDNTNSPFLVIANTGSAMCTTCHLK